jgi:hypothetical protein
MKLSSRLASVLAVTLLSCALFACTAAADDDAAVSSSGLTDLSEPDDGAEDLTRSCQGISGANCNCQVGTCGQGQYCKGGKGASRPMQQGEYGTCTKLSLRGGGAGCDTSMPSSCALGYVCVRSIGSGADGTCMKLDFGFDAGDLDLHPGE